MPADSETTFFFGFLVTGTSLLVAAHAFEEINDPQLRLALQRKGLDARLRRLVLEELVPAALEEVEKKRIAGRRCRGCLWVENARRSAVTLAFCLLRRGLPAEIRQMVMDLVVDGEVGGPAMPGARPIRGFVDLRRHTEQFPRGSRGERRLRWTDIFMFDEDRLGVSLPISCNICTTEDYSFPHYYIYRYYPYEKQLIGTFLSNIGLRMPFSTLNGPLRSSDSVLEYNYHKHDVLAALQVPTFPSQTLYTRTDLVYPSGRDVNPECAVFQATPASLAAQQPAVSPTVFHRLILFGLRSTDLSAPEALQDQHQELETIGTVPAGSALKEPAWTIWTEITDTRDR